MLIVDLLSLLFFIHNGWIKMYVKVRISVQPSIFLQDDQEQADWIGPPSHVENNNEALSYKIMLTRT